MPLNWSPSALALGEKRLRVHRTCPVLARVAKGPGGTFCSTEREKCHFPFPHGYDRNIAKVHAGLLLDSKGKARFSLASRTDNMFFVIDPGALPMRGWSLIRAPHLGRGSATFNSSNIFYFSSAPQAALSMSPPTLDIISRRTKVITIIRNAMAAAIPNSMPRCQFK